jgi:di/tricarboxylate transporter
MSVAALSLSALAVAVTVSCITRLNVGLLSIALAWLIGVYVAGMSLGDVMGGFPNSLFLTLAGVTLLFTIAQNNGTLERVAHQAVRTCRGHRGAVPIMFFLLTAGLASIGPGNIASAALMSPMAMATATRAGISPFLMAIMVGNGASAGSLSPFAPTGVIVNGLMNRLNMSGYEMENYAYNLLAHAFVAFSGYFLFGGLKLFGQGARAVVVEVDATPLAHEEPFERRHWVTIAVITTLIVSVLFAGVHVGMGAFLASVGLVLVGAGDDVEALRRMPWGVIMMVSGVTVLVAVVEAADGIDLLAAGVARFSTRESVTAVVAFLTGIVSVYSSTSGVVLPALLPMVPGLAEQLGANPLAIATSINVGGHLVDVSPLSTTGALCIASVPAAASRDLFNKMLAWGLSMSVVGAIVCYLFFGLLLG